MGQILASVDVGIFVEPVEAQRRVVAVNAVVHQGLSANTETLLQVAEPEPKVIVLAAVSQTAVESHLLHGMCFSV